MMAVIDSLRTARTNYAAQLEALSASPKPTYNVDGQSFSWTEYQKFLLESIRQLDEAIASADDGGDGIVEEITEFIP